MTLADRQKLRDLLGKLPTAFWSNDGALVCPAYRDGETVYVESWRPVAEAASTDYARFIAAANPAAVLALLDEADAANANHENAVAHMQSVCAERNQLKAENAKLLGTLQETNHCLAACLTGGEVSAKRAGKAIEAAAIAIEQAMTKEQP